MEDREEVRLLDDHIPYLEVLSSPESAHWRQSIGELLRSLRDNRAL